MAERRPEKAGPELRLGVGMTDGERILHDAIVRAIGHMGDVGSLRRVSDAGLATSTATLADEQMRFMVFLTRDAELSRELGVPPGVSREAFFAERGRRNAEDTARRAGVVVTATELVFYHSLCDGIASDCCRATTLVAPLRCEEDVDEDTVTLKAWRESQRESVVASCLARFAKRLENLSLPNRIDWLFGRCPPKAPLELLSDYKYDGALMRRLDQKRHDVVHGPGIRAAIEVTKGDLEYLQQTSVFLPHHVAKQLGVTIDTGYTAKALGEWLKPLP